MEQEIPSVSMPADAQADEPTALPLLRAGRWAIGFLVIAVALAVVFSLTMPAFFNAAYHLG